VRTIAERGHEVGSHGHSHRLAYNQDWKEFQEETRLSRRILQDASGQKVPGYRTASFSIGRQNLWALDVLVDAGFEYDSSIFPVVHDLYGIPDAPRHVHVLRTPGGGRLVEVPPSTLAIGRRTLPVAGGGYLRLYPLAFTRWAVRRLNRREREPAVVYVHPWEFDPDQPRIEARLRSRLRHYVGLRSTVRKIRGLAAAFRFGPVLEVIREVGYGDGEALAGAEAFLISELS